MYATHFGLATAPFRITPDTRRFYAGAQRGAVLDALTYAIVQGEGIVKLSGEVGSGKTMLCRMLADRLAGQADVVYLANPSLRREDILQAIALDLRLPTSGGHLAILQTLQAHLIARHAEGRRVVVFVEEAQGMDLEALEEIRLLSNLETREDKLLQLVLFGQPELDAHLAVHGVRQLRDRITHSFSLPPMGLADIRDYIPFRLRAAGYQGGDPFTPLAYRRLARASRGLIRRIHILADKALLAAYADGSRQVRLRHMRRAIEDSEFAPRWTSLTRQRLGAPSAWALAAGLLILVGGTAWVGAPAPPGPASTPRAADARDLSQIAPAAGPVVEKPAPAAHTPATASPLDARIAAARAWLSDDRGDRYTIQIMTSDDAAQAPLERYLLASDRAEHLDRLYVAPARINDTPRWSVLYGSYASYGAAQQALAALPAALKGHGPYLRPLTAVKKEASGHWLPTRQDT
ncbi:MAG: ExeA family protein [Gammaproteobacteria bacterium]